LSKTIALELVVPWSRERMYCGIAMFLFHYF